MVTASEALSEVVTKQMTMARMITTDKAVLSSLPRGGGEVDTLGNAGSDTIKI